ncbi:hypothetical protein E1193_13500 [Micromonospora sp. KC606]|uniref:hypothetical protein n=1 Tax=Micromonospora sp. KC606 TaxID=2530379 RepID=UPI0010484378|nr:hypothetical protein [Micromonospora sp. KC606]TDC81912.1 hypothetical protein E1193_13500 [Micromonospora sp. KC606]
MPISEQTTPVVDRLTVSCYQQGTDAVASFDVPVPIPVGFSISEQEIRDFYQRFVSALENSPDFHTVQATLVTRQQATVTPDQA